MVAYYADFFMLVSPPMVVRGDCTRPHRTPRTLRHSLSLANSACAKVHVHPIQAARFVCSTVAVAIALCPPGKRENGVPSHKRSILSYE